ncbi:SusC/RagA family TonB-linked outer membrane protein [Zunongwangia sp. HGR-M22]|uniref:SusC/RagA family TonB-linked outer membrane protein n=1 Tax=Zunongwangia sp. HGR-M22 TaxID=3015168 RepID=UPI0022DE3234|nr:TonB-dependent receptor [Zunongwangia sp. HGR-M22]WBL24668.1 TonB-dependent receptor [Zunongwangia sp. HGR-M22]
MKQITTKVFTIFLFFCAGLIYAQDLGDQRTISGNVTDSDGEILPGVNVFVKGTQNGVVTDFDGHYTIRAYGRDTLVFSFIGMKTTERYIGGESNIDVVLEDDNQQLDDVVVVGYGTQKRQNITGAVESIEPDAVQDLPVSNLSEALRGQVTGLSVSGGSRRPGDAASLQIRQTFGFSKDGNSQLPLIVIDDMIQVDPQTNQPTLETLNRLDPSEIESITILKDASAAIYGARASQGAVVIKTKRGQIGKPTFNYYTQLSVNDAISHSKTMSAYEYGVFHNRYLKADNRDNDGANLFSDEELAEMRSLNYDWLDKAWESAFQQRHSLNVSGGTEKATYFAGVTYFTQEANLGDQDYDKFNFRTGINAKISSDLDISASISGNSGNMERSFTKATANINDSSYGSKAGGGEQGDYGYLLHMPKYIPITTMVNGEEYYMSPFPRTDRNLQSANTNRTIAGWNYFATLNNGSKQTTEDFSYNVNASVNYNVPFIKGLSIKATYARSEFTDYTEQIQLPYTLARIKNYNSEGNHLASAAEDSDYKIEENQRNSRVFYNSSRSESTQTNLFANYTQTFGEHDISAMVSMERSESSYKSTRLAYENTSSDYLGTNQTAGTLSDNSTAFKGESGTLSYLGRVNYSFRDKYLLQFLFRSDASTKFAPENYWGFFPSFQAGWIMSKESWFENNIDWVDFFKIRYSVGKTGKDNIKPWQWVQYYDIYVDKGFQFGNNGGELGGALSPKLNPNRDLRWDKTIKHNLGFDINVLNNRLSLGTNFYYDKTTDLLVNTASTAGVPISIGGGFAEQNYGAVNAWGAEFAVNWRDNIKSDISYNIGVNFGFSNNEVQKYPEGAVEHPSYNVVKEGASLYFPSWGFRTWKGTSTGDGILRTDEDIQNYWNYLSSNASSSGTEPSYLGITDVDGLRKGMLVYEDVGGAFNPEDETQADPDGRIDNNLDYVKLDDNNRSYGFTTNLRFDFKGFYVRTQISTSWGSYQEFDRVKQGTSSSHNFWAHESYWTDMYDEDNNVDGAYPNLAFYDSSSFGANSDFWQINTFNAMVRNLTLGYQIPKKLLSKINVQSASIGATGNNLWYFNNPYPDNYRNMYDNSYVDYPTLRTWSLNLNLSF